MTEFGATTIKRYIGGKDDFFFLAEYGGTLWASNRYWAVPATGITPLAAKHGIELTAEAAGTYLLNGKLTRISEEVPEPKVLARILDRTRYTVPLQPATIGRFDACAFLAGHRYALFTGGKQAAFALRGDWLAWIASFAAQIDGLDPVLRYATTRKRSGSRTDARPAAIFDTGNDALLGVVMPLVYGKPPADNPAPPPPVLQAVRSQS
jgi:hypothetical protein